MADQPPSEGTIAVRPAKGPGVHGGGGTSLALDMAVRS
jgi:hypothetical protein